LTGVKLDGLMEQNRNHRRPFASAAHDVRKTDRPPRRHDRGDDGPDRLPALAQTSKQRVEAAITVIRVLEGPAGTNLSTPERIARLHAAGFADPGRALNYSKTYPADKIDDATLASDVLTLLHDVYGYYGGSKLEVKTEEEN
jgi:hypothetical protein